MTKTGLEFGISVIVICDLEFSFFHCPTTVRTLYRHIH
jgi:hypothetical protein